jgi:hypothetical protein
MDNLDSIKSKIRALMAKTTEAGCSEAEAILASQKVSELLNKYELSISDLKLKAESKCTTGTYDVKVKSKPPVDWCIMAISKFTDTKCWRNIEPFTGVISYKYFGLESDVMIAEYVTKVVDWALIYGGEDYKSSDVYSQAPKGQRAKILLDFRIAMAHRISAKLLEMKADQRKANQSTGRDLVIVKSEIITEEFAKLNMRLKKPKSKGHKFSNSDAYRAGAEAGDRFQLNAGVKGHNPQGSIE